MPQAQLLPFLFLPKNKLNSPWLHPLPARYLKIGRGIRGLLAAGLSLLRDSHAPGNRHPLPAVWGRTSSCCREHCRYKTLLSPDITALTEHWGPCLQLQVDAQGRGQGGLLL